MSDGITTEGALLEINTGTEAAPVWVPILERAQLRIAKTGETIDMTSFDTEGFRDFKAGLRQMNIEASGNYVPSDAGYQAVETAWIDGEDRGWRASWRTSAPGDPETRRGWILPTGIVTDLGEGGNVGDKVEGSLSIQGGGRPTVYTA